MDSLFGEEAAAREAIAEGAMLLRGFAGDVARGLMDEVAKIVEAAPFRHMVTPGGYRMSVAMTNCTGGLGVRREGVSL
jgi:alkylated DNA repair protein (DNA oxidative demethylase)